MKKSLTIFISVILLSLSITVDGQILNRVKNAAERGANRALEKRVEKEAENAAQRQMEKAFGKMYGSGENEENYPDNGESGDINSVNRQGAYNFGAIMKSINMDVATESAYHFTGTVEMEVTGTDEKGKTIDPVRFISYYNESDDYSGMEFFEAGKKDGKEKTFMIFDQKNNASIILLENEEGRSSMAFSLDWKQLAEAGGNMQGADEGTESLSFNRTGNTKTIGGYLCEEFKVENEEFQGEFWVSKEPVGNINSVWGKNSPFVSQSLKRNHSAYFNTLPEGNILELNNSSKKDKSTSKITLVEVNRDSSHTYQMGDYPNTMKTGNP